MSNLKVFADSLKPFKASIKIDSLSEIRLEGRYRNKNSISCEGFVQFDWWATVQQSKIHICTDLHDTSVIVRSASEFISCLIAAEALVNKESAVISKQPEATTLEVPTKKVKQILLVWNEIPYKARFFVIPEDHDMYATVQDSNNMFINATEMSDDHPIFALYRWIIDGKGVMFERKSGFKARISAFYYCGKFD